jgi:tyrosine-protein phosphatase SIW14
MDDPRNRPALLHCWQGVKRTGIMVAIFRMEYQRVGNAEALETFSTFGRDPTRFQPVDRDYVANYVPRWRRQAQPAAGAGVGAAPGAR